jgi:DnaK suppressor protein
MDLQTQAHLAMLRQLLLYRQSELRAEVHAAQLSRQAAQTEAPEARDFKEGAELMQRQQTEDFQATRDLRELQDVDDALGRLDAGTFGDCAACGEAIPSARLIALPSVRLCTSCQAAQEHRA